MPFLTPPVAFAEFDPKLYDKFRAFISCKIVEMKGFNVLLLGVQISFVNRYSLAKVLSLLRTRAMNLVQLATQKKFQFLR